ETTHKVKNRLEEKKLQAENRLKNGGEATTTDKVKENSQKAWNRTKEATEKGWNKTKEAAQQAGDAVSEKVGN
ncbi:hypothetical protein QKX65_005219, partial [Salmonella enterica]|nr:hypothetical protein [Salmonella enterica]ELX3009258.1 hypothetical protein [Salmonella enterica]